LSSHWFSPHRQSHKNGSIPTANTCIGSSELLKTVMYFRALWVREIIKSRPAMKGLSTGESPSPCVGFSKQFHWHSWAIRTPQWSPCLCLRGRGQPIGAQVNFVHYRHVEPFLTSGGGFLYFNHRTFGSTQQLYFTAQLGGGVQFFTSSRRSALDIDTSITTFRTRIWEIKILDWARICYSSGCRYFGERLRLKHLNSDLATGVALALAGFEQSIGATHRDCHGHRQPCQR